MSIDPDTVRRIAHLARVRVTDEELAPLAKDLSTILDWVEQLSEVDTDGVAPLTSATRMTTAYRDDHVADGGYPDRVLANAPDRVTDFFAVPKVVE